MGGLTAEACCNQKDHRSVSGNRGGTWQPVGGPSRNEEAWRTPVEATMTRMIAKNQ